VIQVVKRYTGLTITDASFSGIRFTHLRPPRKIPFVTTGSAEGWAG
jgi:hypothetical protein